MVLAWTIRKLDQLWTDLLPTIWKPDTSRFRITTVIDILKPTEFIFELDFLFLNGHLTIEPKPEHRKCKTNSTSSYYYFLLLFSTVSINYLKQISDFSEAPTSLPFY